MEKDIFRTKESSKDPHIGAQHLVDLASEFQNKEDLRIEVKKLAEHYESGIVGNWSTLSAFKNDTSYAIGTTLSGLKVIEKLNVVYSAIFSEVPRALRDIIYIEHLNCYLLNYNFKLYRKEINQDPPFIFMDLDCGYRPGKCLLYSKLNKKLIVAREGQDIAVVDLHKKMVEMELRTTETTFVRDLKLAGKKENKICFTTIFGTIHLYSLNPRLKKVCSKNRYQVELPKETYEEPTALAVCDQGEYILVAFKERSKSFLSRIILFGVKGHFLVELSTILQRVYMFGNLNSFDTLGFCKRIGNHLIWFGLSRRLLIVYSSNIESGELTKLGEGGEHGSYRPMRMDRIGEAFYYTGEQGNIMKLKFRFK